MLDAKVPHWAVNQDERTPVSLLGMNDHGQLTPMATVPVDGLLESTFEVIHHVLRARRCSLMLLDKDQQLIVTKAHGLGRDVVAQTRLRLGERIAGRVAATRQPMLITDIRSTGDGNANAGYTTGSFISVPVASGAKLYGVLNAADKMADKAFDEFDLSTMTLLAQHVALCIENAELQAHIATLANTDGLTGVYNHRYFQDRLDEELARAKRFERTVTLLMADLDSFKEFNDRYGHPTGDFVLRHVAQVLKAGVRQSDIVSRYGGDEFTVIAAETDQVAAATLAQRLVEKLSKHEFEVPNCPSLVRITLSIGVAIFPTHATCKNDLIAQADRALYVAKKARVHIACCNAAS